MTINSPLTVPLTDENILKRCVTKPLDNVLYFYSDFLNEPDIRDCIYKQIEHKRLKKNPQMKFGCDINVDWKYYISIDSCKKAGWL